MTMDRSVLALLIPTLAAVPVHAQEEEAPPSIAEKTADMTRMDGYYNVYWDKSSGKLYWEIDKLNTEFLYQVSLSTGLGSNPVGLDRGQLGGTYILEAQRIGPRVLLMQPNYRYRARSDNPDEVRAVEEAFAPSVHWGFDVVATTGANVLVDATDFFLRDTHGAAARMQRAGQGDFTLDKSRSVFYLPRTRAFPENTEIETLLTFTSSNAGGLVRSVAASGSAVTLRQHHSLVKLPDDNYTPREADPRIGANGPSFHDYATPIDENLQVRWVARHRLQKRDPSAARSEPVEPIVYYLDRGVPEPIRSALLDGARWWDQAFEAAGYINAFRVALLPEGADPMDIRYNIIHWTHRSTRGWSYGGSVRDPRTGEIIKGNVNLGSLRLRQDYMKGQGVTPLFDQAQGYSSTYDFNLVPGFDYLAEVAANGDAVDMALARVRQLSAHEVGHTLGFPHNYIASTYGRASVMDYPAPLVRITDDGSIDLTDAYAVGIGEYDKLSVTWLYQDFPEGTNEKEALAAIVQAGLDNGLRFMAHSDNAFVGAGHQYASVWDNGSDLVEGLRHEMEVRRIGLESFGPAIIRDGEALSTLEHVLVPLYLHHRFQLTSAIQNLGGADYTYALRGDGQIPITIVSGQKQREALEVALATLTVEFLAFPEHVLQMIPPSAYRAPNGEAFAGRTGLTFDPLGAAEAAAHFSVTSVLHPERMARLVEFGSRGAEYPDLGEVVDGLIESTWSASRPNDPYRAEVQRVIQRVVVDELVVQASNGRNRAQVRAILTDRLLRLAEGLEAETAMTPHQALVAADIRRWERRPERTIERRDPLQVPPGSPIGGSGGR